VTDEIVVPDVPETFLGFRVWRYHEPTLTLWSVTRGTMPPKRMPRMRRLLADPDDAWPPDETLVARCDLGKGHKHGVPDKDCTCGVYAATDVDIIAPYLREAPLMGLIQGSGRTIPGEDGWRAARCTVTALFDLPYDHFSSVTPRSLVARLADRYRVPVIVPHSDRPDDYRQGVRTGFADGWQLDFHASGPR